MRIIGMDIHRDFAEVMALEGGELTHLGRVDMTRDNLAAFAVKWRLRPMSCRNRRAKRRRWSKSCRPTWPWLR